MSNSPHHPQGTSSVRSSLAGDQQTHNAAWRLAFGGLLSLGMMLASIWIYIFGALAPFWIDEFDITRTELGGLTMVLYIVGAFGSVVAGRVVDSLEGRRLLLGIFLMAGVATLGITLAQTMSLIYAATVLAGVAMAAGNPTTNKLVARLLPPGRQGDVMGLKQAGVQACFYFKGWA